MNRLITTSNFNGHSMIKISQLRKNGKPSSRKYVIPPEHIKAMNEDVASCRSIMSEDLDETIALIRRMKKPSDRVEMYEFAITTAEQVIKNLQEYKKEFLLMLPPPFAEPKRRIANGLIAHHKSSITQFKKEIELTPEMA
jgi:hypothetical protein